MKKIAVLLSLILCMSALTPAFYAETTADAVYSENGENIPALGDAESYTLFVDDEQVLKIEKHDDLAPTGVSIPKYYSAQFIIPDTTFEVYLTGLKSRYAEEIRQKITESYAEGVPFDMTDLGFIDTEKTLDTDNDDNLCWAAATSNILTYTGWAAVAGFKDEDAVFDSFVSSFSNNGGYQLYALAWFFNGAALKRNLNITGSKIYDYPNSGGYLNDYAFDMLSREAFISSAYDMDTLDDLLRNDWGVSLGINIYNNGSSAGGHAITLWGLVTDTALDIGDPNRYKHLFITDSDSDELSFVARRYAKDVLSMYPLYTNSRGKFCFDYNEYQAAELDDFVALERYSSDIERETDPSASHNKISDPDLNIADVFLSDEDKSLIRRDLFESGSTLYPGYTISAPSDKLYSSQITLDCTIKSADGTVIFNNRDMFTVDGGLMYLEETLPDYYTVDNVPAGDYTLTFDVNPNRSPKEAFYYNNTYKFDFKVRDSYIIGDYDNNGSVEIPDATFIQRRIADMETNLDDKADERGDFGHDGLSISDATVIQRSIADIETSFAVGEKALYTDI